MTTGSVKRRASSTALRNTFPPSCHGLCLCYPPGLPRQPILSSLPAMSDDKENGPASECPAFKSFFFAPESSGPPCNSECETSPCRTRPPYPRSQLEILQEPQSEQPATSCLGPPGKIDLPGGLPLRSPEPMRFMRSRRIESPIGATHGTHGNPFPVFWEQVVGGSNPSAPTKWKAGTRRSASEPPCYRWRPAVFIRGRRSTFARVAQPG